MMRPIILTSILILVLVAPNMSFQSRNRYATGLLTATACNHTEGLHGGASHQLSARSGYKESAGPTEQAPSRWYIYLDANSPDNHGEWTNYMPDGTMLKINMVDKTDPASGSSCVRVDVALRPASWTGIAVASRPDYWGLDPGPSFDLRKAKRLVFSARGDKGGETIQIKAAIAGDKKYGDSARIGPASSWISLSKDWKVYSLSLRGYDLSRVITPFAFVTNVEHNKRTTFIFFLDEIYMELEDK